MKVTKMKEKRRRSKRTLREIVSKHLEESESGGQKHNTQIVSPNTGE